MIQTLSIFFSKDSLSFTQILNRKTLDLKFYDNMENSLQYVC